MDTVFPSWQATESPRWYRVTDSGFARLRYNCLDHCTMKLELTAPQTQLNNQQLQLRPDASNQRKLLTQFVCDTTRR